MLESLSQDFRCAYGAIAQESRAHSDSCYHFAPGIGARIWSGSRGERRTATRPLSSKPNRLFLISSAYEHGGIEIRVRN